jgi:hypothetical protein
MVASTGRHCVALLLGAAALTVPALASAQEGGGPAQVDSGFALQANLGARDYFLGATGTGLPSVALPTVGLTAGYKFGRILLGLGLEFSNTTSNVTMGTGAAQVSQTTSDSNFLIGPDVEAALVRTADGRVELLGHLSLHFGHQFHDVSTTPAPPANNNPTDSNFLLSYVVAPGLRYWVHSHFAVQAVTGFGGQAFFDIPVKNNPATGNNSQHGISSSFGLLGVF